MKIEFNEYGNGASVCLTPETPKEVAQLFRITNNMKKEPAHISLSMSSNEPYCLIHLDKIDRSKQSDSISK
jgi:hypothetical protein